MDQLLKPIFAILFILVPGLCYFIFKPSAELHAQSVQQAKEFATYIEQNPNILKNKDTTSAQNPASNPSLSSNPNQAATGTVDSTPLSTQDRASIYEIDMQWKQADLAHDQRWRDQVEYLFGIAQKTKDPNVLDLLRYQIIAGKNDPQAENQNIAQQQWYERYLNLESRPQYRTDIESAFKQPSGDSGSNF